MPLPLYMTIDELKAAGYEFRNLLARTHDTDPQVAALAQAALKGLDARDFSKVPLAPGKDKSGPAPRSQQQIGEILFQSFLEASTNRAAVKGKVAGAGEETSETKKTLQSWVRKTHRLLAAIKRDDNPKALAGLPLLGELQVDARLRDAAEVMIKLLAREDVLKAAAPYAITSTDVLQGEHLLGEWAKSVGNLGGSRGVRSKTAKDDKTARETYASWLTKWWDFARVELEGQPAVLQALGVEIPGKRGGAKSSHDAKPGMVPLSVAEVRESSDGASESVAG